MRYTFFKKIRKSSTVNTLPSITKKNILILFTIFLFLSCDPSKKSFSNHQITPLQQEAFWSSSEEKLKGTVWDVGDTTISNEDRYDLFQDHIKDLEGGYFGVGSIQNFTFSAWARSEWVWLMDFTKIVVATNKIHIAFLKVAKSPDEFRFLWSKKGKLKAHKIIQDEYQGNQDYLFIKKTWRVAKLFLEKRFRLLDQITKSRKYSTWLHNLSDYEYLRQLAIKRRIRAIHGDLNGNKTVKGIADAANKMKVPIRVIYFSNAEEYFKEKSKNGQKRNAYSTSFHRNWLAVPTDKKSIVIRTISFLKNIYQWPEGSDYSTDRGFHYNIMSGSLFQEYLSRKDHLSVISIIKDSKNFGAEGYSVLTGKVNHSDKN